VHALGSGVMRVLVLNTDTAAWSLHSRAGWHPRIRATRREDAAAGLDFDAMNRRIDLRVGWRSEGQNTIAGNLTWV